jgi:membrane protein
VTSGFIGILKNRFLSFTMVLGIGFLLLVSLLVSAGLAAGHFLGSILPTVASSDIW